MVYTHTYTMEYYLMIKKNGIIPSAATWMDLEIIILSEVSQTNTIWHHSYVESKKKKMIQMNFIYKIETDLWLPKGEKKGRKNLWLMDTHYCSVTKSELLWRLLFGASLDDLVIFTISGLEVSYSLWPHGLQHIRLPCPSLSPRVCSNSCPLSQWCYLIILSYATLFSFCLQSFPSSESFPMSRFFASDGQSIGVSASASVLPMNIQDLLPLGLNCWISLQSKGLSRVFSNTTVQKHQFFST